MREELQAILGEEGSSTTLHLKTLIEQMPGGFFIYRANGNEDILYANHALLQIFNCGDMKEFRELTGNSFRGLVHPDDLEQVEKSIWEQIANNQNDLDYVQYRIIQKGGAIRWVEDYGHFIHTKTMGDVFYVFVSDATERLENVNQELLRRLRVIEGLSVDYESIFHVNLDSNTIQAYRVSYRFQEQFGHQLDIRKIKDISPGLLLKWVCPEDRPFVTKILDPGYLRKRLKNCDSFHENYRILNNRKQEYLQFRAVNTSAAGQITHVVIGIRNVDEEIQAELKQRQILEAALKQSEAAMIAKNTFLSNMSHDMRTPMNAVMGFSTLAKKNIDNTLKLQDYLDHIQQSSGQMLQLITDVLEISRLEAGNDHVEEHDCDLVETAIGIQTNLLPRAKARHLALTLDTIGLKHTFVRCDQQKLEQLLFHLAGNAIKYTNAGGEICISLKELSDNSNGYGTYRFTVEDTGIGIQEDFLAHIFEPFEREKNTTLSGVYGTGLGLTIVKNIVEMMGGTIEVHSETGKGSRFIVTFIFRILNHTHSGTSGDTVSFHPGNYRILVVEDNELNMAIETDLLESEGFLVDTAANGSIALEKVKNSQPGYYSLILMDIQMPVMDGHLAARAIRHLADPALADIPIIALSANAFEEDRRKSIESGMNFHLAKPMNFPQLMNLLEKTLTKKSS